MLTVEQISESNKSAAEAAFGLANKTFAGFEKFVELNMQAARTTLSESAEAIRAALATKDAQEFFALQTSVLQPAAEKAASYSRQAYEIVSATGAEIRAAAESTGAEVKAKFGALVENAPGGDKTVALVKSAVAAANTAYETAQKAVKQATELAEANFEAITKPVVAKSKRAAA